MKVNNNGCVLWVVFPEINFTASTMQKVDKYLKEKGNNKSIDYKKYLATGAVWNSKRAIKLLDEILEVKHYLFIGSVVSYDTFSTKSSMITC
jgi:hypothetical protein